jgi:hypothetical protein
MPTYYVIMTDIGLAKQAAWEAGGDPITLEHLAVGDSNGSYYTPDPAQTALVNQVWIGDISRVYAHPSYANRVVIEATIPSGVGGWDIREVGLFDTDGDLVIVGKYPLTTKPAPGSGAEKELRIQVVKELTDTAVTTLTVDSGAFATNAQLQAMDWKDSVKTATTANITFSGMQTIDGVVLSVGDEVLVKDQTTASQNGIYIVASGAWARREDANADGKMTANMVVAVEQGTVNTDTVWMLTTNDPITVGTTALSFVRIYPSGLVISNQSATFSPTANTWYRIAASALNIGHNFGAFLVKWTASSYKGTVALMAGCVDGGDDWTRIDELARTALGDGGLTKARIVYHTTPTGNYAYLEVMFGNSPGSTVVDVQGIDLLGWTLVAPGTAGSIPPGYSSFEHTFGNRTARGVFKAIGGFTFDDGTIQGGISGDTALKIGSTSNHNVVLLVNGATIATLTSTGAQFTHSPTAPTPVEGDSSTKLATTEFIQNALTKKAKLYFFGQL